MIVDRPLLPRIFEPFIQGRRGSARAEGGLGIGLALVRTLVQLHGGAVSASSPGEGCGSVFEVSLPLADVDSAVIAPPSATPAGGAGRVLVVDDNVEAAELLALQLRELGYTVDVVYGGRDAVEACTHQRYLACVIDNGLPDVTGIEVASRLKAQAASGGAAPLLIAASGDGQAADIRVAREAGFDHYQVKPIDLLPLSHLLRDRAGAAG